MKDGSKEEVPDYGQNKGEPAFVPYTVLAGMVPDPTYAPGPRRTSDKTENAIDRLERSGNTVVAFPKKLRAA